MNNLIDDYSKEIECSYENELYSVRDNRKYMRIIMNLTIRRLPETFFSNFQNFQLIINKMTNNFSLLIIPRGNFI